MKQHLIKTWHKNGFNVRLFNPRYSTSEGRYYLSYRFSDMQSGVVFSGNDYGLSPLYSIDSIQAIYDLLGFITLSPGDTDSEYFDNYTPEQLTWCTSNRCNELKFYLPEYKY